MILSAHQPAFLPWPGYLSRIRKADKFALVVGVQYEEKSFTNRNRIKTEGGVKWLTVPVKGRGKRHRAIRDVAVVEDPHWKKKHLKTIRHAYSKAPRFEENWPKIEALYGRFDGGLWNVCLTNLRFWLNEYGMGEKLILVCGNKILQKRKKLNPGVIGHVDNTNDRRLVERAR